jgi:ribosomal protein S18 acetylase RimI-like enzyme
MSEIISHLSIPCESMLAVQPITRHTVPLFMALRLRALQDSPAAFSSTYDKESQLADSEWIERLARWTDQWTHKNSTILLATDDQGPCGIAGSFLHPDDATTAQLVSMWTAPAHRRLGVGRLLVNQVLGWARSRQARTLCLNVTSTNQPAILFYERLGFTRTARTRPYANDPALLQYEMSRPTG